MWSKCYRLILCIGSHSASSLKLAMSLLASYKPTKIQIHTKFPDFIYQIANAVKMFRTSYIHAVEYSWLLLNGTFGRLMYYNYSQATQN